MNTQEKELKHCTACNQMTNHSGETCLKHTPDTEENAYSRGYKQGRFDADMDRLNKTPTPDTEWESVELAATNLWAIIYEGLMKDGVKFPNNFNGIGAAYGGYARIIEAFGKERSSRDTYWKERVRKEVEGMKRKITFNGSDESGFIQYGQVIDSDCEYNQALDTLLDNLK